MRKENRKNYEKIRRKSSTTATAARTAKTQLVEIRKTTALHVHYAFL